MYRFWICFGCIALISAIGHGEVDRWSDYEYYADEIENYPNSNANEDDQDNLLVMNSTDSTGFKVNEDDSGEIIYNEEYEQLMKILNNATIKGLDDGIDKENDEQDDIDDYQIEDNRSEVKEDTDNFGEVEENIDDIDVLPKYANDMDVEASEGAAENIQDNDDVDDNHSPSKFAATDIQSRNESNKESKNEFVDDKSLNVSRNDINRFFNETEDIEDEFSENKFVDSVDIQKSNIKQFIAETKKILNETDDSFDEEINMNRESKSSSTSASIDEAEIKSEDNTNENLESKSNISTKKYYNDEDNVAKTFNDLKNDLKLLRETRKKLEDDVGDSNINKDNFPGFDERDSDLVEEDLENEDDYEVIEDKDLFKLFKELPEEYFDDDKIDEIHEKEIDEIEPALPASEVDEVKSEHSKLIQYVDDALNANEGSEIRHSDVELSTTTISTTNVVQEHQVEPLEDTPNEFDIFIGNEKSSADPIRITLSLDEPVLLTSPNYPNPYPTNAVIDWILEGDGKGIEFNVTDFALNSVAGDYVMVKPGRVDPSGSDGFLLSYSLKTPRAFRFLNVNRMFIRFDSKLGLNRFRGFSFSIKMINPLPEDKVSEPEVPPIGYPESIITLNLGGVTLENFHKVKEEFRQILADMATMYIEVNQIDPGLNTTSEVTQITSTALCYHNWPQFEQCVEVRFGVPLQYENEGADSRLNEVDLRDMWLTYSDQDPFALRLQRLGVKDFQIPNDSNVLMMWLVIAAGVVISMAMLAFALWRFSCFEDYTRMPAVGDTESVNEKKTLDLYPTPHQTLPPLYSDTEYRWTDDKYEDTARVDMSGFSNRNYVRTEDYDFDSEEEVAVHARDRYTTDV